MVKKIKKVLKKRKAVKVVKRASAPKKRTYSKRINSYAKSVGGYLGGMVGIPQSMGRSIGSTAHKLFKNATGYGDYKISKNSCMGLDPPLMHASGRGSVRIRHREFIRDVVSSAIANTFFNNGQQISVTNPILFPWLSTIAGNFQEWDLLGCIFEFKTMSSDTVFNSSNTSLGQVIMSTNYNANGVPFKNKSEMENSEFASSCKPSESMLHPIECDPSLTPISQLYVAQKTQGIFQTDKRFESMGLFQIATNAVPGTAVNLGELWVSYDIQLAKPVIVPFELKGSPIGDHWQIAPTAVTNASLFGVNFADRVKSSGSNWSTLINPTALNRVYLPTNYLGRVMGIYTVYGTTATLFVAPTITYSTNITAFNQFIGNAYPSFGGVLVSGTASSYTLVFAFDIVTLNNSTEFTTYVQMNSSATLPGGITGADLFLMQAPASY